MSHETDVDTIRTLEYGVFTSASIMMPCGWVPAFIKFCKENPGTDAGLHLTLTSEWSPSRNAPGAIGAHPAAEDAAAHQGRPLSGHSRE